MKKLKNIPTYVIKEDKLKNIKTNVIVSRMQLFSYLKSNSKFLTY